MVYTVGDNEVFTALQSAGDEVLRRIIEIGEHLHMSSPILVGGMPDIGCDTPGIGLVYGRVREQAEQQISDLIGTHALTLSASDVTAFAKRKGDYTTSYALAVREALSRRGY